MMATIEDFQKLDIRTGVVVSVEDFPGARKPAYKLTIDLGKGVGTKKSSVRITDNYTKEELMGKQVLCVLNFPPMNIGPFVSEVLTLGVPDEKGNCVLVAPNKNAQKGGRLY